MCVPEIAGSTARRLSSAAIEKSVHSETGWSEQRPLGSASKENKVLQQAVVTILNQIYEEGF